MTSEGRVSWGRSFLFHALLATVSLVYSALHKPVPSTMLPTLRVDLVALPDKAPLEIPVDKAEVNQGKSEAHKAEATVISKPEVKKNPKDLRDSALDALRRMRALQKFKSESVHTKPESFKGNVLSRGTSRMGQMHEGIGATYYEAIRDRVRNYWKLPHWLSDRELSATIHIYVDSQGRLVRSRVLKSSGVKEFDDHALDAVQASLPFPPPPSNVANDLLSDGFSLGFPL